MFLNIQIDLIILKTHDQQFTLTTKKSLHIIFKANDAHEFDNFDIAAVVCSDVHVIRSVHRTDRLFATQPVHLKPNSITQSDSNQLRTSSEPASVMEFGFYKFM